MFPKKYNRYSYAWNFNVKVATFSLATYTVNALQFINPFETIYFGYFTILTRGYRKEAQFYIKCPIDWPRVGRSD